jgi:phage-related protein
MRSILAGRSQCILSFSKKGPRADHHGGPRPDCLTVPHKVQSPASHGGDMVASGLKRIEARFFVSEAGREPVREWLLELDHNDRRQVGRDLMTLEFGWPIGMPLSRSMGAGLHELRSSISGARECRLFFYVDRHERLVLLHAFIKRSRATPKRDLDLARARMRQHQRSKS